MARALSHDVRLMIMDEPSAVLDPGGVENLFRLVDDLRRAGVGVVYISHRLDEIRRIGDRITVLKDGRTVATNLAGRDHPDGGADPADDRPVDRVRVPAASRACPTDAPEILPVQDSDAPREFADVDLHGAGRRDRRTGRSCRRRTERGPGDHLRRSEVRHRDRHRRRARPSARSVTSAVARRHRTVPGGTQGPGTAHDGTGLPQRERVVDDAGSRSAGFLRRGPERAAAHRETTATAGPAGRSRPGGADPVRRQPAEGGAGPLAAARLPGAAARRADPRGRCRCPRRDLRA